MDSESRVPLSVTIVLALFLGALPAAAQRDSYLTVAEPRTKAPGFSAVQIDERSHVSILEVAGNYDKELADGSFNQVPRTVVAQELYKTHPDHYDILLVFSTFEFETGDARAFHWNVQNDVEGLGLDLFDHSPLFGSGGRLHSYIDMVALTRYVLNPLDPRFDDGLGTAAHEIMHRWGVFAKLAGPGGSEDVLLGKDLVHWSFLVDSDASLMLGNEWRANGDGTFTSIAARKFYSPLDLYLAGFYGPEEVPPFLVVENPEIDPERLSEVNVTITGTPRTVTIDEIVAANGPRLPAAAESPHDFRAALVLLVRPGDLVDDEVIAGLDAFRRALLTRFPILTGGRGLVEVFPEAVSLADTGSPTPVGGGAVRDTAANLADAMTWLRAQQQAEGFWQDTAATRLRDTTAALTTLQDFDPLFSGGAAATSWLAAEECANLDELARAAETLDVLGASTAAERELLAGRQNGDGGWGLGAGYASNPIDTSLALLTLAGHSDVAAAVVDGGGSPSSPRARTATAASATRRRPPTIRPTSSSP